MGLGLWMRGYRFVEVVIVGLWVCEGWPVRTWQCLVVGLLGWGCVFGIVEVGLWFASDEKEEKSPERREEETEKSIIIKKKKKRKKERNERQREK